MRSFLLNKLVRDKIVADMQQRGQRPEVVTLDDAAFIKALKLKIQEEAQELANASPENEAKELADLQEAIDALAKELGISSKTLAEVQEQRREQRGGFNNRQYIGRLELNDDDSWADYYAKDPDKYIEIKPEQDTAA